MEYNIYAWASKTTGVRGKITIMKGNRDDSGQKQAVLVCDGAVVSFTLLKNKVWYHFPLNILLAISK